MAGQFKNLLVKGKMGGLPLFVPIRTQRSPSKTIGAACSLAIFAGAACCFRGQGRPGPEPLFDHRSQRAIGCQLGLRLADRLAQWRVSLAHADG
jgi:hypothetical protein